jgi:hypothetical protein
MKKTGSSKKEVAAEDIESQIRETLRQFARQILSTPKLRESAAKAIGHKPSYLRAMLDQRGKGGLSAWATIVAHCFGLKGLDLLTEISRALANPDGLSAASGSLSPSELIFRNLEKISVVDEDVKFEIATTLDKVFKDVEKNLEKDRRKK